MPSLVNGTTLTSTSTRSVILKKIHRTLKYAPPWPILMTPICHAILGGHGLSGSSLQSLYLV